jgi:succinylglutamic semialdehyde dehydrogenase
VHEAVADRFISALIEAAKAVTVGDPSADPPVFIGPIIREDSRHAVIASAFATATSGGEMLVEPRMIEVDGCPDGHFVTPGVVRVPHFTDSSEDFAQDAGCDVEVFGPFVRVTVVENFDRALEQANATRYGLAASIFTQNAGHIARFLHECHAGCLNVNAGTAGASSKLPFGGMGLSGNHRPAGSFSLDYCAHPVASMVETGDSAIIPPGMTWDDNWVR